MKKRFAVGLAVLGLAGGLIAGAAQAAVHSYTMVLNGLSENPPNDSAGTGNATIDYDDAAHTLALNISFSGLTGTTTASHFHAVTATSGLPSLAFPNPNDAAAAVANVSVATTTPSLVSFPLGVSAGSYSDVLDLTAAGSWNPAFVTAQGSIAAAEAALAGALAEGKTYWNVHTTYKAGGEIRGFPVLVPEPAASALLAVGLGLIAARRRR
jgi:hypothetical protein